MLSRFREKITPIISAIKNSENFDKKNQLILCYLRMDLLTIQKKTGKKTIKS